MSSTMHRLSQTIAYIIHNSSSLNRNSSLKIQLLKSLKSFDYEVKDILVEIAIHDGIYQKRLNKIEHDIKLLQNKNSIEGGGGNNNNI